MDIVRAGLKQQPFHTSGKPVAIFHYRSEQAAYDFLNTVATSERGIGLLYGPDFAGKKTIIRHFLRSIPSDIPVAIVDGRRLNKSGILDAIRSRFACESSSRAPEDSLKDIEDFIAQHARWIRQPLLIVENFNTMHPSALIVLRRLAALRLRGRYAIRMVLVGNEPSYNVIDAPETGPLAARTLGEFRLRRMTSQETTKYLYTKLLVSGCVKPEDALPAEVCEEIHSVSGGWPGTVDSVAIRAIAQAENWPIRLEHVFGPAAQSKPSRPPEMTAVKESVEPEIQKLYLTLNRQTLREFELRDSKTLIGRSVLCDISISSRFVSKYHALIVHTDDAMHLLDLKSTNGTFVNSGRIQSYVLRHDDVISLGNHGIKLISPKFAIRPTTEERDLADTVKMKSLSDLRRLRAQSNAGNEFELSPLRRSRDPVA
jgi:general secretion pathway protein A